MQCEHCGSPIPQERLEALPNTTMCKPCSENNPAPFLARMIYSHKTAGELFVARNTEDIRRLEREYRRAR
jgi:hypothetical protein